MIKKTLPIIIDFFIPILLEIFAPNIKQKILKKESIKNNIKIFVSEKFNFSYINITENIESIESAIACIL